MNNDIKNAKMPNYFLGSLTIITEGLRSIFDTALSGQNIFYKTYLGYQYMEHGYIISYENSIYNLSKYTIQDAVKYLHFNGLEPMRCLLSDIEDRESFIQILNNRMAKDSSKFFMTDSQRIDCDVFGNLQHFYIACMLNKSEWIEKKIPLSLITSYFDHIMQNNSILPKNFSASKTVIDHINSEIDVAAITKNVCEQVLRERFGKKRNKKAGELFDFLCNLACKPYEGAQNKGIIRFATDSFEKNAYIKFENSVPCTIENVREIRKLLEMTDVENPLIVNARQSGLGQKAQENTMLNLKVMEYGNTVGIIWYPYFL